MNVLVRPAAVALALTIGLAACASGAPEPVSIPTAQQQTTIAPVTTSTVAPRDCEGVSNQDSTASYAPDGPLPGPNALPAGSTMADIKRRGRLIVGTAADVKLFAARDPLSGRLEGFDIDLAREVARAIFGDPNKIEFKVITYAQRIPFLQNKSVDLVAHTMTIKCARWKLIAFSAEYFAASQRILVRRDQSDAVRNFDDLDGQRVCVAKGSTNIEEIAKHPKITAVPVDELGECLVKFQRGEVSAITGDDTVLRGFAAQDKYAFVTDEHLTEEPYGLGISKDQRDFARFVNAMLESLRSTGRWNQIYCTWLAPSCTNGAPTNAGDRQPAAVYGR